MLSRPSPKMATSLLSPFPIGFGSSPRAQTRINYAAKSVFGLFILVIFVAVASLWLTIARVREITQIATEDKATNLFLEEVCGRPKSTPFEWRFLRSGSFFPSLKYDPLEESEEEKYILVLMPFAPSQTEAVKRSLAQWEIHSPCDESDGAVGDLILFTSSREALTKVSQIDFPHRCFRRVSYLLSSIPPSLDQYRYAPPYMFFEILISNDSAHPAHHHIVRSDNDFMLSMEPDVWPVADGWLSKVAQEMRQNNFWIRGSRDRCPRPQDGERDNNINGNAFYRLHDQEFLSFLALVKEHYHFGELGQQSQEAYDYSFNHFLLTTTDHSYRNRVISMLEVTDTIYNHPHYSYRRERLPVDTVLVHCKGHNGKESFLPMSRTSLVCVVIMLISALFFLRRRNRQQNIFQL